MNKAIFLDRDGTINVDKNYVFKIEDFEFLPSVLEGLKRLQDAGFLLFIITNQSGIARGYFTEQEYLKLDTWIQNKLYQAGIRITKTYYCPHLEDGIVPKYSVKCQCRKPDTDFFERAIKDFSIDVTHSYAIGDKERDLSYCLKSEMHGYKVYHDSTIEKENIKYITGGIIEAAADILMKEQK